MKRPIAHIAGTGRYAPAQVLTNQDWEARLDTSDQWIRDRSGIAERRVADDRETIAYMASEASKPALAEAGLTPADVDAIVLATASWDRLLPSQACDVQAVLGAKNAAAFLAQQGIPYDHIYPAGFSSNFPDEPNESAHGRSRNRRVEVRVR